MSLLGSVAARFVAGRARRHLRCDERDHRANDAARSIVHSNFRIDDLIFDRHAPRVLGVLDWQLSTLGDPVGDFAYHATAWPLAPESYRGLLGQDLAVLGIPGDAGYCTRYCARTGQAALTPRGF